MAKKFKRIHISKRVKLGILGGLVVGLMIFISQIGQVQNPFSHAAGPRNVKTCPEGKLCMYKDANYKGNYTYFTPHNFNGCIKVLDADKESFISSIINNTGYIVEFYNTVNCNGSPIRLNKMGKDAKKDANRVADLSKHCTCNDSLHSIKFIDLSKKKK